MGSCYDQNMVFVSVLLAPTKYMTNKKRLVCKTVIRAK